MKGVHFGVAIRVGSFRDHFQHIWQFQVIWRWSAGQTEHVWTSQITECHQNIACI